MARHATMIMAPSRPTRPGRYALPPALLAKARGRVGALSLSFLVIGLFGLPLGFLISPFYGFDPIITVTALLGLNLSAGAVYAAARWSRLSDERVLDLALVLEVVSVALVAGSVILVSWSSDGVIPFSGFHLVPLLVFPLVVPNRPSVTVVVSLVAGATVPLTLAGLAAVGAVDVQPDDYLRVSVDPFVVSLFAGAVSAMVQRLNRDAARALELGSYRLETRIGAGGMGEVWRARHELLARPAAVKLVRADAVDAASQARFEREAQVTANLTSPHTVELYDFGIADDGTFFYVMELLDGLDLDSLVRKHGTLTADRAVHLLQQACDSLEDAHFHGLVHRDVKPANIMTCRRGKRCDVVKVLDFGLVALAEVEVDQRLTREGALGGTPAFIAPEVVLGQPADARSDLYALGCVAYWLLVGDTVFSAPTPSAMMVAHVNETPVAPSARAEVAIPEALDALILECLRKDPAQRPQSAAAVAERLRGLGTHWSDEASTAWWDRHRPLSSPTQARVDR